MKLYLFIMVLSLISVTAIQQDSFAQESYLSVQTDDRHYDEGDTIVISGIVSNKIGSTSATLQVFNESNLVEIIQVTIAQDGTYSHTILAEGPLWKKQAEYTVRASYGVGNIAETEFTISSLSFEFSEDETVSYQKPSAASISYDVLSGFELIIERPYQGDQNYDIFAHTNESTNAQNLKSFILSQNNPTVKLQNISDEIVEPHSIATKELLLIQSDNRWNSDGTETDEYIQAWIINRAYNDIDRIIRQVIEMSEAGMSVESAFVRLGYKDIEPTPEFTANVQIQDSITVTTDKPSYSEGETIVITGEVRDLYSGTPVSVIVLSPRLDTVSIAQVEVGADKKFSTKMTVGGALMITRGTYFVEVRYGIDSRSDTTTFEFKGTTTSTPSAEEHERISEEKMKSKLNPTVSVWTDKTDYAHNEIIMVTGQVGNISSGFPVTITVISPLNSIVTTIQLTVTNDGSFETPLNTATNMWKYDGTYTIKANYGSAEKSNSAKVVLSGGVEYIPNYSTPYDAYAQLTNDSITVQTDKPSYSQGETIVITGEVRDLYSGTPVSVIVKAPNGNLASIIQVEVDADKKFRTEMDAGDSLMEVKGSYTITVQYGTANRSATTTFYFEGSISQPPTNSPCGAGTIFDETSNSCVLIPAPPTYEPELTDRDVQKFEKKIKRWNAIIGNFERNADKFELRGNMERADYLKFKATIYESLIEHLEDLIYK